MSDLRARVSAALNEGWQRHINDQTVAADTMAEAAIEVFAAWVRERVAAAQAERAWTGRCACGRATLVSERSGRITALGMLADAIEERP